jgi:SAM-dependent methyltransferase
MSTSWGKVADWYDDVLADDDSYQAQVILPNLMRLLAPERGETILDLACGQGFFSRASAERGAEVIGVDISKELIAIAEKEKTAKVHNGHHCAPRYFVSPSHELGMIKDASIDKTIIVLALQNIEKIKETVEECSRVLKQGGRLYIVLNHPAFRIPKRSSWGFDEAENIQYRRIDGYLSEAKILIDMHPGMKAGGKKGEQTISFHRPLQVYFKHLGKAGFGVTRLEEWESHKKSEKGKRSDAEDLSRKEIPLFLCVEAIKL